VSDYQVLKLVFITFSQARSQNGVVVIVTGISGVRIPVGLKDFYMGIDVKTSKV
jgi:hypothetical protein